MLANCSTCDAKKDNKNKKYEFGELSSINFDAITELVHFLLFHFLVRVFHLFSRKRKLAEFVRNQQLSYSSTINFAILPK